MTGEPTPVDALAGELAQHRAAAAAVVRGDDAETFTASYVPGVATIEDRLAGRVTVPGRTVVEHPSGWRIEREDGARTSRITSPAGESVDVRVFHFIGPEPSDVTTEPTPRDLARALAAHLPGGTLAP